MISLVGPNVKESLYSGGIYYKRFDDGVYGYAAGSSHAFKHCEWLGTKYYSFCNDKYNLQTLFEFYDNRIVLISPGSRGHTVEY